MKKLLIATHLESTCTALARTLSQYEVHICSTGTDALTMLETLQPDILILDLMLPEIDGITVLRQSGYKPPIILALTNLASTSVLQAAVAAGAQDVLLIPCTIQHITKHLYTLIEEAPSPEI